MHNQTESVLARVSQQLSHLEKRDGELWLIVSLTGLLVGAGLLAVLFPAAFLKQGNIHFELTVSRPLVLGLVALLTLLNTYLVSRRMEIRRLREELISRTIQQELVQQQSFTDPLTEIYNRQSLGEMAGRFMCHARRSKKPLTLMLIDVDGFKDVNTRFGHLTGDVVLANTAALLKHSVRGSDAVFRYGGVHLVVGAIEQVVQGLTRGPFSDPDAQAQLEFFQVPGAVPFPQAVAYSFDHVPGVRA